MKAVAGATGPAILSARMFLCHGGQAAKSSGPVGAGEFLYRAGERR